MSPCVRHRGIKKRRECEKQYTICKGEVNEKTIKAIIMIIFALAIGFTMIACNDDVESVSSGTGSSSNPFLLYENQWASGTISADIWYYFPVTAGRTYRIWIDDYDARDTHTTGDVVIRAYYSRSNGDLIWPDSIDGNWVTPAIFTSFVSDFVFIRVSRLGRYGSYRIVYSTRLTRP